MKNYQIILSLFNFKTSIMIMLYCLQQLYDEKNMMNCKKPYAFSHEQI